MKKIDTVKILLVLMFILFLVMLGMFLIDFNNDIIELGNIIENEY